VEGGRWKVEVVGREQKESPHHASGAGFGLPHSLQYRAVDAVYLRVLLL